MKLFKKKREKKENGNCGDDGIEPMLIHRSNDSNAFFAGALDYTTNWLVDV